MLTKSFSILIIVLISNTIQIIAQETDFNVNEYKSHLKFLSDDLLQGRLPGTPGGDLAALYIASQFERFGLQHISDKTDYYQQVPIRHIITDYNSVDFKIIRNDIDEKIEPYDEVLLFSQENKESIQIDGELVFVGYGIEAPEYEWDDFKGKDMKGKFLVILSGHPDFGTSDYLPGNTTYYGHWNYKPRIAQKKGAKGVVIIHNSQSLFPWNAYQENYPFHYYDLNEKDAPLALNSWVTEAALDRALKHTSLSTQDLIEKANNKNFEPFHLNLNINVNFKQNFNYFSSPNVVGLLTGTENPQETIIYMAHYDHLGIGTPVRGDSIYNGAIDNASGMAALLTLAEYFSNHPQKRSIIFLATTAEEIGFLGAEYYLENPIIAHENTIVGLNMDMLNFLGAKDSIELSPVVFTDAVKTIKEISSKMDLGLILSDYDNEFINFRLDSYPFALHDIVTLNILNLDIQGNYLPMPDSEKEDIIEAGGLNYHTPFDEVKPWFRYDGILQELELAKEIGIYYANEGIKPIFNKENPFEPAKLLWNK